MALAKAEPKELLLLASLPVAFSISGFLTCIEKGVYCQNCSIPPLSPLSQRTRLNVAKPEVIEYIIAACMEARCLCGSPESSKPTLRLESVGSDVWRHLTGLNRARAPSPRIASNSASRLSTGLVEPLSETGRRLDVLLPRIASNNEDEILGNLLCGVKATSVELKEGMGGGGGTVGVSASGSTTNVGKGGGRFSTGISTGIRGGGGGGTRSSSSRSTGGGRCASAIKTCQMSPYIGSHRL